MLVTFPTSAEIRHVDWSLDRPAQINRSAYTGARTVVADPWHGRWSAKVELAPIVGEDNVRRWRAFLASVRGAIGTFRIPATEGLQASLGSATLAADAAEGATSITLDVSVAEAGHYLTIADQLLLATSVAGAVVNFEPALRAAASAGDSVEIANPTCLVAMTGSAVGYSVDPGQVYGISFDVEEVF